MHALRILAFMIAAYTTSALILISAIGGSGLFALKVSAKLLPDSSREKSSFETQLETARHIRQALSKPPPAPEPLPPLTAKRANPAPQAVAVAEKPRRIPNEARNAMAMETGSRVQSFPYAPVDRFAPN